VSSPCASAERELCWCRALRGGDGGDRRDQVEVLLEVRALKARRVAAVIAGLQIVDALYMPSSMALWIVAIDSASLPRAETFNDPSLRYCMTVCSFASGPAGSLRRPLDNRNATEGM
jgi:hypothetical protein